MVEGQKKHVASAKDIQDRMTYQFGKFIELFRDNTLTPQWGRFGERHARKINQLAGAELLKEDNKARTPKAPLNKRSGRK